MTVATIIDKHVGNRVRVRRHMLEISQQDLAKRLDVTFQQVQKYEKGTNRISASRLWELSLILRVSVDFFFEGLEDGRPPEADQNQIIDDFKANSPRFGPREYVELNQAYHSLGNEQLKAILVALVEAIADHYSGADTAQPRQDP